MEVTIQAPKTQSFTLNHQTLSPCVRIVVASNFPTRQKLEDLIHDESTLL